MTKITTDEWLAELEKFSQVEPNGYLTTREITRLVYKIPEEVDDADIPSNRISKVRGYIRKLLNQGKAVEGRKQRPRLGGDSQFVAAFKLVEAKKGKKKWY